MAFTQSYQEVDIQQIAGVDITDGTLPVRESVEGVRKTPVDGTDIGTLALPAGDVTAQNQEFTVVTDTKTEIPICLILASQNHVGGWLESTIDDGTTWVKLHPIALPQGGGYQVFDLSKLSTQAYFRVAGSAGGLGYYRISVSNLESKAADLNFAWAVNEIDT